MEMRTCSKCGWTGPLDQYPYNPRSKSGRRAECHKCLAAKKKAEYASPLIRIEVPCYAGCQSTVTVEIEPGTKPPRKICSYCQEWGSPDWLFSRRPKREDNHATEG